MYTAKRRILRFQSNLEGYEVTVYDGCQRFTKRIFSRQDCLCLCTQAPCLRVVARPLESGYSTILYFWIDTSCSTIHNLYFSFPQDTPAPTPPTALNTFTLTDANYGLPIDGALSFTQ